VKLLLEDLRFGNAASLVVSLLFYGLILILLPRMMRRDIRNLEFLSCLSTAPQDLHRILGRMRFQTVSSVAIWMRRPSAGWFDADRR